VSRQLKRQKEDQEVKKKTAKEPREAKQKASAEPQPAAWETDLDRIVHEVAKEQKPPRLQMIGDIFRTAAKLAKESPGTLNLKITATTLKELRYSFKMFYPHRFTPKITMFGSARVPPNTPLYDFAKAFAMDAVKHKYMIVTGGGPGIMAAGNEGAELKGGFGLNIRLPVEQTPNPFIDPKSMLIHYKYFFTRKLFLVKEAMAFAFFPGGFGTFDEAFEVLTLLQTGKSNMIPVVMLEPKGFGFWEAYSEFMEKGVLARGFISESDKSLYHIYHSSQEALEHIDHFYSTYHSMRLVKEFLVIRLKRSLSADVLKKINSKFSATLAQGKPMKLSGPLPDESNEPELEGFPRLVFPFDRRDYGSLRRLIDFINDHAV
jgi:uncharacterized protein (TIGR00730 family)